MTNYSKYINQIINYLNNTLSNTDRHTLEHEINADPFLSDALDGFSKLTPNELQHDLSALTNQLSARTKPQSNRRIYLYAAVAASLVLFIGIGVLYHNYQNNNAKLAQETNTLKTEITKDKTTPVPLDTLTANPAPANPSAQPSPTPQPIKPTKQTSQTAELRARRSSSKKASTPTPSAPTIELKGYVKSDSDSLPLPGASIRIKGTQIGTVSGFDGEYALLTKPTDTLIYSFIGYTDKEIAATEVSTTTADIALNSEPVALEELVVVGYGTQKKKEITGSVSSVSSSRIHKQEKPTYTPNGGFRKFNRYIRKNKRITPNQTLEIEVELTITPNGQVDHIRFLTTTTEAIQAEITRLLTHGPTWHPNTPEPDNNKVTTTIKL